MAVSTPLHQLGEYASLQQLADALSGVSISDLFAEDEQRAEDFTIQAAGLTLDYSKQLLSREARDSLLELAQQAQIDARIAALLSGEHVNNTEDRPALHTLLRASSASSSLGDKFAEVEATRARMRSAAERLYRGEHTGHTGAVITDVVNIGIGGSDLGPRLVSQALEPYHGSVRVHYVANVDPADITRTLAQLNSATTAFIICSKSFRTEETLTNSLAARNWMLDNGVSSTELDKHFLAVTTNLEAAAEFGIGADNCLPMWDWVGGRYSVWSAVGLSCAVAVGWDNFAALLAGAEAMDEHFASADAGANMPLLMALLEVWYGNFWGAQNHVVLPYDDSLQRLPDFLQQLTMESNGKRVSMAGTELPYATGPVMWGSAGTMGQHSFHQLLHQGTVLCPADFVLPLNSHTDLKEQHQRLVANCLAQSRTMMVGRSVEDSEQALLARGKSAEQAQALAPHLSMPGNRPNSVITMDKLTPATLGALLALYEHRTFCSGQLWGINPFDQWGVELGKEIGTQILGRLQGSGGEAMDPATERLLREWQKAQD